MPSWPIPDASAADFLALLAGEDVVAAHNVAVVVAHPDDETIGCGALLPRSQGITLVHVTDGTPRNMRDGRAHGFDTPEAYAAARRRELEAAAALARIGPEALVALGVPDQRAAFHLADLARRLVALFAERGIAVVLTHAYEGGHPDHDAVAFAVHAACCHLSPRAGRGRDGGSRPGEGASQDRVHPDTPPHPHSAALRSPRAPAQGPLHARGERRSLEPTRITIIEMPLYHAGPSGWVTQRFIPDPERPELAVWLSDDQRELKRRMMAAYATQQGALESFTFDVERFRAASDYDFTVLPNGGDLLYERYDWGMTGARWRTLVRAARDELRLEQAA